MFGYRPPARVTVDGVDVVEALEALGLVENVDKPGEALQRAGAECDYSPAAPLSPRALEAFKNLGIID